MLKQKHRTARVLTALAMIAALAIPMAAPAVAQPAFKIKVELEVISATVDPDTPGGPTLHLLFRGEGSSPTLGRVRVVSTIEQHQIPGCDPAKARHVITSRHGNLVIEGDDLVCGSSVTGTWTVTGADGDLADATGDGETHVQLVPGGAIARWSGTLDW